MNQRYFTGGRAQSAWSGQDEAAAFSAGQASATDQPLVSVLINNYNYGRFLRQAIESVISQTYREIEVVVVDDGSTDELRSVISEFGDKVRPILKANGGQSSTLNAGFAASHGDIICLLDSDDWFYPNKVQTIVQHFKSNRSIQWVFDPVDMTFMNGMLVRNPNYTNDIIIESLARATRKMPPTSGLSFARPLLSQILPMSEDIRIGSDNYLKWASAALAPGLQPAEAFTAQRIHDTNEYTLRTDKLLVKARIYLFIARDLRNRIPGARRFGDKVFAKAAADYLRTRHRDSACERAIASYLRQCSPTDLIDLLPRTAYQFFRRMGLT